MFLNLITFFFLIFNFSVVFSGELLIIIKNVKNINGFMHIALYDTKKSFPKKDGKFLGLKKNTELVVNEGVKIKNLKNGNYAVAVFHDENSNNKFDSILGIPLEGYGFSNNPTIYLTVPTFEEAKFLLHNEETKKIEIFLK